MPRLLSRRERQIRAQVAAQVPREETGLEMREQAERRLVLEQGMNDLLLLALLVGAEDDLAARLRQQDASAVALLQVLWLKLLPVDQRQGQPIRYDGAKLLHQVEGKGG